MSAVISLPAPPRVVQIIRQALAARADVLHAPPATRDRAMRAAIYALRDGASTGWAIQCGIRVLRRLPAVGQPPAR